MSIAFAILAALAAPPQDARALDGEWIYVEDRTAGRPLEEHQPSMGGRLRIRIESDAFVLVRSDGEVRVKFDGSPTDVVRGTSTSRYTGGWKDGAFVYQSQPVVPATGALIVWTLRATPEGLVAGFALDPPNGFSSVALYKRAQDIALPVPAKAVIGDVKWIAGGWVGSRGTAAIEERWSPPSGGAMLAVSRTVRAERMVGFEFLRIVERDGSLVYIAQPNGAPPTEFVLVELGPGRAVFANPRHDSPQKITYELTPAGLSATIGFMKGGRGTRFEFRRE